MIDKRMQTKLMMITCTILSCFGCTMAQKKELTSVSFDYSVERIDYRLAVTVEKTGDTFSGSFQERPMQKPETFTLTRDDFNELIEIVVRMGKPAKKRDKPVTDESREGTFTVVFNREGKDVVHQYEIGKFSAERETNLKNEAIDLIKRWIDRHKRKGEIRIGWTRALPVHIWLSVHAEPADLVEYLGEFVEQRNQRDGMSGGGESGTHRWKALKPGVVTVWSEESHYHYTAEELTKEFEPCCCFIIDENLNVHYSEEETKAAKERFISRSSGRELPILNY